MNLTASKTAINVIATYCNKHGITFEQQDKTISFEKVTIPLRSDDYGFFFTAGKYEHG